MKRLIKMRHNHIFHFGQSAAQKAIGLVKAGGDYPILETSATREMQGKQIATTYSWGTMAIMSWLADEGNSYEITRRLEEMKELALEIMELLGSLIRSLIKELRLVKSTPENPGSR